MLVWGSAGLKATQVHEMKGVQFLTSWKIPALVRGSAGVLTAHFHFMKKGMGLLCSSCGPCYEKCQAFYLFISCKMHALVWGVAGLLATHFHEMKNDRGGSSFSFHGKMYTHWVRGRVVVLTLLRLFICVGARKKSPVAHKGSS